MYCPVFTHSSLPPPTSLSFLSSNFCLSFLTSLPSSSLHLLPSLLLSSNSCLSFLTSLPSSSLHLLPSLPPPSPLSPPSHPLSPPSHPPSPLPPSLPPLHAEASLAAVACVWTRPYCRLCVCSQRKLRVVQSSTSLLRNRSPLLGRKWWERRMHVVHDRYVCHTITTYSITR